MAEFPLNLPRAPPSVPPYYSETAPNSRTPVTHNLWPFINPFAMLRRDHLPPPPLNTNSQAPLLIPATHARIFSLCLSPSLSLPIFSAAHPVGCFKNLVSAPHPARLERPVNINAILIGNTLGDAGRSMNKLKTQEQRARTAFSPSKF